MRLKDELESMSDATVKRYVISLTIWSWSFEIAGFGAAAYTLVCLATDIDFATSSWVTWMLIAVMLCAIGIWGFEMLRTAKREQDRRK